MTAQTKNLSMKLGQGAEILVVSLCFLIASCIAAASQSRLASDSRHGVPHDPQTEAAFDHFYNMDYDRATQEFEKIVERHPNDPFALNHLLTAVLMAWANRSVPLYVAYLLVLGVNRFFLASLSAALPHVVPADKLVMANSVSPTAGGIMALIGGLAAGGLNAATGDTERGAAITMLVAGCCYVAASLVARTMHRDLLGPVHEAGAPPRRLMSDLASVTAELWAGARYAIRRRGPATALGATGGSKFLYGILFVMSILLYRNYFYPSSAPVAEGHYLVLASISGIGYFCAALVVPPAVRRLSKPTLITLLLAVCAVATAALGETFVQVAFLAFGFFLYLTSQGVAICATTILQEEVADAYRGRMFAFYDVMFNVTIAAGALISVGFMPRTGRSPVIMGVVAAAYAVVAAGYWLLTRQPAAGGEPGTSSPSAAAQSSSS